MRLRVRNSFLAETAHKKAANFFNENSSEYRRKVEKMCSIFGVRVKLFRFVCTFCCLVDNGHIWVRDSLYVPGTLYPHFTNNFPICAHFHAAADVVSFLLCFGVSSVLAFPVYVHIFCLTTNVLWTFINFVCFLRAVCVCVCRYICLWWTINLGTFIKVVLLFSSFDYCYNYYFLPCDFGHFLLFHYFFRVHFTVYTADKDTLTHSILWHDAIKHALQSTLMAIENFMQPRPTNSLTSTMARRWYLRNTKKANRTEPTVCSQVSNTLANDKKWEYKLSDIEI